MKLLAALLVSFALLGFVGMAQAAKKGGKKGAGALAGTIVKVADDQKSVTVKHKDKATGEMKEVDVAVDSATAVTLDGVTAKIADLKAGQKVKVSPANGTATKVDATTPKKRK